MPPTPGIRSPAGGQERAGEDSASAREKSSIDTLEEAYREVSLSCLTEAPDLDGLKHLVAAAATSARVVPDSVTVDPGSGRITGELDLGSRLLTEGSFEILNGHHRIEFRAKASGPFLFSTLVIAFQEADREIVGGAGIVQFHGGEYPKDAKGPQFAGWSLAVGMKGTVGEPIMFRHRPGGGIEVGRIEGTDGYLIRQEWEWSTQHFSGWRHVLAGVR